MLLMKQTHELKQEWLDEGRVSIMVDLGFEDVLVSVRVPAQDYNPAHVIAGYVSRYQIVLAMEDGS